MAVFTATAIGTGGSGGGPGTDTFTGTNGSGPPDPWIAVTLSGSQSIQSNQWRITNGASYAGTAMTRGATSYTDVDITVEVTLDSGGAEQYPAVGARLAGGTNGWAAYAEPSSGYEVYLNPVSDFISLGKYTGGGPVSESYYSITLNAGTTYKVRLQLIGTAIRTRVWAASGSEPGSWQIEISDATYASGLIGFRDQAPSAGTLSTWDNFVLDDDPGGGTSDVLGTASVATTFTATAVGSRTAVGSIASSFVMAAPAVGANVGTPITGGAAVVAVLAGR